MFGFQIVQVLFEDRAVTFKIRGWHTLDQSLSNSEHGEQYDDGQAGVEDPAAKVGPTQQHKDRDNQQDGKEQSKERTAKLERRTEFPTSKSLNLVAMLSNRLLEVRQMRFGNCLGRHIFIERNRRLFRIIRICKLR